MTRYRRILSGSCEILTRGRVPKTAAFTVVDPADGAVYNPVFAGTGEIFHKGAAGHVRRICVERRSGAGFVLPMEDARNEWLSPCPDGVPEVVTSFTVKYLPNNYQLTLDLAPRHSDTARWPQIGSVEIAPLTRISKFPEPYFSWKGYTLVTDLSEPIVSGGKSYSFADIAELFQARAWTIYYPGSAPREIIERNVGHLETMFFYDDKGTLYCFGTNKSLRSVPFYALDLDKLLADIEAFYRSSNFGIVPRGGKEFPEYAANAIRREFETTCVSAYVNAKQPVSFDGLKRMGVRFWGGREHYQLFEMEGFLERAKSAERGG